jgi:deoxyribonuclease-4
VRRIGFHTSIAGGIHKSLERVFETGCNTLQIFSHNPRGWTVTKRDLEDIRLFRKLRKDFNISPVFVHASYLINLASLDKSLRNRSVAMVVTEMNIADEIGADFVVLHSGSASRDEPARARKRAAACFKEISVRGRWKAGLLLENTAGERGDITSGIEDLAELITAVPGDLISGVCIDTCHAYSAGYDLSSSDGTDALASEISTFLGKEKIKLLHLNDARGTLGGRLDRHEHIGKGNIGIKGFRRFLYHRTFMHVPIILETPKRDEKDDERNIRVVKRLLTTA